jgi:hypothetical protein
VPRFQRAVDLHPSRNLVDPPPGLHGVEGGGQTIEVVASALGNDDVENAEVVKDAAQLLELALGVARLVVPAGRKVEVVLMGFVPHSGRGGCVARTSVSHWP